MDGANSNEGRVEVYYNGAWGTVCDDLWDDTDAGVVCNSLGFGNTGTAVSYAGFGEGTGDIILDDVQCTGSESNLASCPNRGLGLHNCGHSEDAGVRCSGGGEFSKIVIPLLGFCFTLIPCFEYISKLLYCY